ncbi:hypothetical protein ATCV1_z739R [Acanthocystis turfacea chlorella virus 1]|uniref:Uncharacterized protein z739R n=1 Tax=Chlorovirus heliozoae TaxID=322019 RepID=A7K9Z9_9PHYC|nr:hypothetical protein ATCV1_z739R [Acanthocystis turfacea chlorella virus 1]ABT16873.1 hypothetical protein ATCV1_z739R [Acanthocystis turfacea chlorella virus 1]
MCPQTAPCDQDFVRILGQVQLILINIHVSRKRVQILPISICNHIAHLAVPVVVSVAINKGHHFVVTFFALDAWFPDVSTVLFRGQICQYSLLQDLGIREVIIWLERL